MCGRSDGAMRWALEAIAAGVGGSDLATWTLARVAEWEESEREKRQQMDRLMRVASGRMPDDAA